jgi:hypothetical protein
MVLRHDSVFVVAAADFKRQQAPWTEQSRYSAFAAPATNLVFELAL